jgi:hypothetical protein
MQSRLSDGFIDLIYKPFISPLEASKNQEQWERQIPIVGAAVWAFRRILEHDFPAYCDGNICKANSSSAALNKCLKKALGDGYVAHGLRFRAFYFGGLIDEISLILFLFGDLTSVIQASNKYPNVSKSTL